MAQAQQGMRPNSTSYPIFMSLAQTAWTILIDIMQSNLFDIGWGPK